MRSALIALVAVAGFVASAIYFYPGSAFLTVVKVRTFFADTQIAPAREIAWQQGPEGPVSAPSDRPPNIVLIVADDLGYNDISTFGGGVASGRLQTSQIDSLAAQGAVFTQSYSGSSTCAPSEPC